MEKNKSRIVMPNEITRFNYIDYLVDRTFGIETVPADKDEKNSDTNMYNYLPTTYAYFEELFNKYPFDEFDHFVDIGCGKGRALIMAALFGCRHIHGIEINKTTYEELVRNFHVWQQYPFMSATDVQLLNQSVLDIELESDWNKFFLFKSFSDNIFEQTMLKIHDKPASSHPVYVFLYHPNIEVVEWIEREKLFHVVEKDIQVVERNNGPVKTKIRSVVYSDKEGITPVKSRWRY